MLVFSCCDKIPRSGDSREGRVHFGWQSQGFWSMACWTCEDLLGLWGSRTSERREGPGKAGMDAPSGTCPIVVTKNFQKESFSLVHGLRTTWKRHGSWCIRNKLGIASPLQIVHHHWINGKVILWRAGWWSPLPGGRSILVTELQSTPLGPPCWYSWPLLIAWLWIVGERWAWRLILIGLSVLWLFTRLARLLARVSPVLHSLASTALDPQTPTHGLTQQRNNCHVEFKCVF